MIVDCFPFFNELDLLELRLRTLEPVVDRFVLVEATTTQTGRPKPLYFEEHRERFAPWRDRIVHLIDRQVPTGDARANEWRQRDVLASALADLSPDDVVLMSDCDEIPDPARFPIQPAAGELLAFEQILSLYFVNFRGPGRWLGTRAFRAGDFRRWGSMHAIRGITNGATVVPDGGWHISYLGDREFVRTKLLATADVEFGIPYFRDPYRLDELLRAGHSIIDAYGGLEWTALDATFPAPLRADPERWRSFLTERPPHDTELAARARAHGIFAYVDDDCDGVAVIADDPDIWLATGRLRFDARFAGVAAGIDDVAGLLHGRSRPCIVADAFERRRPRTFLGSLRARFPAATVVTVTRNARSFDVLEDVVGGAPFPPGEALGVRQLDALFAASGFVVERRDCLPRPGFWLEMRSLPGHLGLQIGRIRIDELTQDQIPEVTATDFITAARVPV